MTNKLMRACLVTACVLSVTFTTPYMTTEAAVTYSTPSGSSFKAYMDYRTITCVTSNQYKLQQKCTTSPNGFRQYQGRYTIAIGTGYDAPVGTFVDVELSTGVVLKCIVGDIKSDKDTDATHKQCKHNNSVVEFIVDTRCLNSKVKSYGSASALDIMAGDVVRLTRYTDDDMLSVDWESVVVDQDSQSSRLITDKFTREVSGKTLYFVQYASKSDYSIKQVTRDKYDSVVVGVSTISI